MLKKLALFVLCLSTALGTELAPFQPTPDQQLDMAIECLNRNGPQGTYPEIDTLLQYSEGLVLSTFSPEKKTAYIKFKSELRVLNFFGPLPSEKMKGTFLGYSLNLLGLMYIGTYSVGDNGDKDVHKRYEERLSFFHQHGGLAVLPIVVTDGLLPEELINRAMSHRIAPMGCALTSATSYDGFDGNPFELATHDIDHFFFNQTSSYLLGAYKQAFLKTYDICGQLCSLLPRDSFYSLNHYWIFQLIHEAGFATPRRDLANRAHQPDYYEIDRDLTLETFTSASDLFLNTSNQKIWQIKADLTKGETERIIAYDTKTQTFYPPPSDQFKSTPLLKSNADLDQWKYKYSYRRLVDLENALHSRGILDFNIWVDDVFNGQGMVDVLTMEICAFQIRMITYAQGTGLLTSQ